MTFDQIQAKWIPLPIDLGPETDQVYIVLFGSGLRGHGGVSGVSAKLGGREIPVLYAGAAPDYVGLDQINLGPIPRSLIGATVVPLVLNIESREINPGKAVLLRIF
jgi:uncharacterized protein (TIGR03437 family)